MTNYKMRGIQFLTNGQGKKTGAFVDLKEHSAFWEDVLAEFSELTDFQFLADEEGKTVAVLWEFDKHIELWENIYDSLMIELTKDKVSIPFEEKKSKVK